MVTKWIKRGVILGVGLCVVGTFLFGGELISYCRSSANSVREAVKSSVPTEFELRRARDMLEEIIPEMQANIRLIAQEEVEIASLKDDIAQSKVAIAEERERIQKVSAILTNVHLTSYRVGDLQYTREQLKEDLARRFDLFKEAEVVLSGKQRLLASREKSLSAAMQLLERTRTEKALLAQKIEALESKHRYIQTASVGTALEEFDNSKLVKTEKLIAQIKKRLDIAERVLAHESRFVQPIPVDTISEDDLLTQVQEYFHPTEQLPEVSVAQNDQQSLLTEAQCD